MQPGAEVISFAFPLLNGVVKLNCVQNMYGYMKGEREMVLSSVKICQPTNIAVNQVFKIVNVTHSDANANFIKAV